MVYIPYFGDKLTLQDFASTLIKGNSFLEGYIKFSVNSKMIFSASWMSIVQTHILAIVQQLKINCGALRFFCWLSLNCFCVIMLLCVVSRLPIMNLMRGLYFNWSCMVILLCIMTQPSFLNLTSGLCAAWLLLSRCV